VTARGPGGRPAWLDVSDEVRRAIADGRPVVALESSLVAQGLPPPDNIETARAAADAVREVGAVPATVAIGGGRLIVGADDELLERLADPTTPVAKAASRDIGPLLAARGIASTTVSATMRAAHLAGIAVFATGGIGGVHRGGSHPADVSSDIDELAVTPVAVVCSGGKSILDLPATIELLETRRVPVIGLGTGELPAFYSTGSGLRLEHRADTPDDAAGIVALHRSVPGAGGILLVQPPPADVAIPAAEVDAWVADALAQARRAGIGGGRLTPFLLAAVADASGGRTLRANTALIVNNARVAAQIAGALAERGSPRRT
jgi:pseudouridine-5'-phosphate glycosidase